MCEDKGGENIAFTFMEIQNQNLCFLKHVLSYCTKEKL